MSDSACVCIRVCVGVCRGKRRPEISRCLKGYLDDGCVVCMITCVSVHIGTDKTDVCEHEKESDQQADQGAGR